MNYDGEKGEHLDGIFEDFANFFKCMQYVYVPHSSVILHRACILCLFLVSYKQNFFHKIVIYAN